MSIQSPISRRSKSPSETVPSDNLPHHETGGQTDKRGPKEEGPKVPDLKFGGAGHQGGVQSGPSSTPTHSPAPMDSGGASHVESDDAKRTGGYAERFVTDRGHNS